MKMRLALAVLLIAGLAACGGGGSSGDPGVPGRQWTYMVYMGADNNLSSAGAADINEMETAGSNGDIAIVVQAEFSAQYTPNLPTDTRRIYVENDGNPNSINLTGSSLGNANMGDPATLTAFINWAKANYPAQHYALVIWDHGAGWKAQNLTNLAPARGAVQDETSGSFMSLPDLAKAVSDSGTHFDIINFDACLMGMYEVAYEFRTLADYMVFSEETEPGAGDPYDTILTALKQNPTMSSRTLASTIVDKYQAFYLPDTRESTTKSAIDMSQIDALDAKVVALAKALEADAGTITYVQAAQANTQAYAHPPNHDLFHFCQYLNTNLPGGTAKTICGDIVAMKNSIVVNSKTTGSGTTNSQGLAIYIPTVAQTNAGDLAKYELLKCNLTTRAPATGTWGAYVSSFTSGGSGGYMTATGGFALRVTWTKPDSSACDADVDLYVYEPDLNWYAPWMGQTSPNGFFSQDSLISGQSVELYLANDTVMAGYYDILVNYYDHGASCTQALVHIEMLDPANGLNSFTEIAGSPVTLDLVNHYVSGCTTFSCLDGYSDWWYPGFTQRMLNGATPLGVQTLPNPSKSVAISTLRKKKSLPLGRLGK